MTVHPAAASGFTRAADAYERGRPSYPADAVAWLSDRLGSRIVDLAAGTGMLTTALAAHGFEVVAVEPVAAMRARIAEHERVRIVDGTAEAIPAADASADGVTVAQAFHWFDAPRALAEIHRVLRPDGVLALLWNRRRMEDQIHRRIHELLAPHRGDVPTYASDDWRTELDAGTLFEPVAVERFDNVQRLDAEGLVDRFGSTSFVAALDEVPRSALHDAFRALASGGPVTLRYRTEVEILRRRA